VLKYQVYAEGVLEDGVAQDAVAGAVVRADHVLVGMA
jgi:hypothetical protein